MSGVFRTKQSATAARRAFEREAENILYGWVRRRSHLRKARVLSLGHEDPTDWMRRYSYGLIRSLIAKKHAGILDGMVSSLEGHHRGKTDIAGKPFKQALLVMFWWNPEPTSKPLLDRRRRSELSDAMEYAHRHRVPAKHLNGFIKQANITLIPAKLRGGIWEPGFERLMRLEAE